MKISGLKTFRQADRFLPGVCTKQAGCNAGQFTLPADTCDFSYKHDNNETKNPEKKPITQPEFTKCKSENLNNYAYNYKLSDIELNSAARILARPGSGEYKAIIDLARDDFVCIKDMDSAYKIFQNYHKPPLINPNSRIFVLDPHNFAENDQKKTGTSNEYMSKWYAQANNLDTNQVLISGNTIEDLPAKSRDCDDITIIVPDDCSITGRSLTVETAECLNKLELPLNKKLTIVFAPLVSTPCAKKVFEAISDFDIDKLVETGSLNKNDYDIMEKFFEKYKNAKIAAPEDMIEAKPFREAPYFINLKNQNPKLAQTVDSIMSYNGTRNGYGRPEISGLMVAVPSKDGGLKCPNNNAYGATPFALAAGAKPENIKRPGSKITVKKWYSELVNMFYKI